MKIPLLSFLPVVLLAPGALLARETGDTPLPAKLVIAPEDILETRTVDLGERRVTVQKIAPLELPPIPGPVSPPDPLDPAVQERIRAARERHPRATFVLVGATVYRSTAFAGGPRTEVRLRDPQGGGQITCWSSADWDLLGWGGFADESGTKFALVMSHGSVDLERRAEFAASRGGTWRPPEIPAIPAGPATFVVTRGEPSPEALAALGSIHDFYNSDLEQLKARRDAREADRLAREAYLRANPPVPKNLVIRHWRMDAAGQGGVTPKPAVAR